MVMYGSVLGLCISTTSTKCSNLSSVKKCHTFHNLKFKNTQQILMSSVVGLGRD